MIGHLRFARSFLTPQREYALRRAINGILPVAARSRHPYVVHACVWKSGSQWIRMVLSDPRIYRHSGLQPLPAGDKTWKGLVHDSWTAPTRRIITPVYATYDSVRGALDTHGGVAFFVQRDPRDLLVSRYFSRLAAHPLTDKIGELRAELGAMPQREGMIHVLSDFEDITSILRSWADGDRSDGRFLVTSYEDLTGPDAKTAWRRVFAHADIKMPESDLASIMERYSFKNMSGGREVGQEVINHKYRKGQAGDWVNHFDDALKAAFIATTGDLVERLGYSW